MSPDELRERAADNLPGGRAQFDPITLMILMAILSGVIQWLVTKCLNNLDSGAVRSPGPIRRWQLRRAVRECCSYPEVLQCMGEAGLPVDAAVADATFGDRVYAAVLATGQQMADHEIRATFGG